MGLLVLTNGKDPVWCVRKVKLTVHHRPYASDETVACRHASTYRMLQTNIISKWVGPMKTIAGSADAYTFVRFQATAYFCAKPVGNHSWPLLAWQFVRCDRTLAGRMYQQFTLDFKASAAISCSWGLTMIPHRRIVSAIPVLDNVCTYSICHYWVYLHR